jgi:hypothetical protein
MIRIMRPGTNRSAGCRQRRGLQPCRPELGARVTRRLVQLGHRLHCAIDGYAAEIVRVIGESYGQQTVQTAWKEFNIGQGRPFCGYDANAELFYSWLFHKWAPVRERGHQVRDEAVYGIPPTRAYLDRGSPTLNPLLRLYLEACLATSARFYEVLDCDPGLVFRAREVFTGAECTVNEPLASTSLKHGDILYAHLIPIGHLTLMDAISPRSFPPQSKWRLLQLCRERRTRENGGPELRRIYFALSATAP